MQFINTIFIAKSLHAAFLFTGNLHNVPLWNYAVVKIDQISEGPIGLGSTFRQERIFLGRPLIDTFIVTEYKIDSSVTIKSLQAEYPFLISYYFKPVDNGTLVTNRFELKGGLVDILGFLLNQRVKNAVAGNLQKLKELIEKL